MAVKRSVARLGGDELAKFPSPHLAVDVALMTVAADESGQLRPAVLLHRRRDGLAAGEWALPGRMVRDRERVAVAVQRALVDKCGIEGIDPALLFVLDEPTRDSRGWVVSIAYLATQPSDVLEGHIARRDDLALAFVNDGQVRLPDRQAGLPFEHDLVVQAALERLRETYDDEADPGGLMPTTFTIRQLREVHEAILGRRLDKDTFRRHMEPHLSNTGRMSAGTIGKPARLFSAIHEPNTSRHGTAAVRGRL